MVPEQVLKKVSRRILPFFFALYIIAYLDRANVAFAKLDMVAELGFSEEVFGFGAGVFFVGYFLLEIPGALIVERWSARLWLARILITWGLITVLTGFVKSASQFYVARFLLGLAEASFFPSLIVYMTHWFPLRDRARAMAGLISAVPVSFAVGAPLSALILRIDWLSLPGWRWVFILEGLPAVIFGLITIFCLTDRPCQARWLSTEERNWLTTELERESQEKRARGHVTIWKAFFQRNVVLLSLMLLLVVIASYGYLFWLPTNIQKASGYSAAKSTALSAIPFVLSVVAVRYMGKSSDRNRERRLHTAIPLLLAGVFLGMTTVAGQAFSVTMLWLSLTGMMLWAWAPSFWVLPTLTLSESAAAASIGLINSVGNLGGFFGPWTVGALLSRGHSYSLVISILCAAFVCAAALTLCVRVPAGARAFVSSTTRSADQTHPC
jgi:MFS transporter, ACS family, tartrate transporter